MPAATERIYAARIALVNDGNGGIEPLAALLRREGFHNVDWLPDPAAAVDHCLTHPVDLVLLDVRMRRTSGIELLLRLGDHFSDEWLPVIVVTGDSADATRIAALAAGAQDYVLRPYKEWEMVLRVRNLLVSRLFYRAEQRRADHLEEKVRERTSRIRESHCQIVDRLGRAGEYRDNETGAHVLRMSRSCQLIGAHLGLADERTKLIHLASKMHDLGKIGIPDSILLKPGKLTSEEWDCMRRHTVFGADIIGNGDSPLLDLAWSIAMYHHERWDGGGYPAGLKGTTIPLPARIAAVADVFDALTSVRPYKARWPAQAATEFVRDGAGSAFDPAVVDAFLAAESEIVELRQAFPDSAAEEHAAKCDRP